MNPCEKITFGRTGKDKKEVEVRGKEKREEKRKKGGEGKRREEM